MLEYICLIGSMLVLALCATITIFATWRPHKWKLPFNAFTVLVVGVFVSATIIYIPFYIFDVSFDSDVTSRFATLFSSIHSSIKLFIMDSDFNEVVPATEGFAPYLRGAYIACFGILFLLAPIMTAGAVLMFLQNVSASFQYICGYFKDVYIFSELNERSFTLAKNLKHNDPSRMIVFTDVFEQNDEESHELIDNAKKLGAICFKRDITLVNFRFHSKNTKMYFFIMGSDETENINQTIALQQPYEYSGLFSDLGKKKEKKSNEDEDGKPSSGYDFQREDTRIYVFSESFSSDKYLGALKPDHIKIRHVNELQSLVHNLLYNDGMCIFNSAKETDNTVFNRATNSYDKEKKISALIIGMGSYGTEMIRGLSWAGQMHPYRMEINAIDKDPYAASKFQSLCPELFDYNPPDVEAGKVKLEEGKKYYNNDFTTPGEAHYKISVYGGYDAELFSFDEKLKEFTETTYVFVSLGDDERNVQMATKIRILFDRMGIHPVIHTVVNKPSSHYTLTSEKYSPKQYDITPYGDISKTYTEDYLLQSHWETLAFERHMAYTYHVIDENRANMTEKEIQDAISSGEDSFWKNDYNYRSSIASAIHTKLKRECDMPGARKKPSERTEDELWFYRIMEHCRWNAYVRSEGYIYAPVRNRLAKTHHLLVPFDKLPYEEQIKDDD